MRADWWDPISLWQHRWITDTVQFVAGVWLHPGPLHGIGEDPTGYRLYWSVLPLHPGQTRPLRGSRQHPTKLDRWIRALGPPFSLVYVFCRWPIKSLLLLGIGCGSFDQSESTVGSGDTPSDDGWQYSWWSKQNRRHSLSHFQHLHTVGG